MKSHYILVIIVLSPFFSWAQDLSVTGKLTDATDNSPLVGATIQLTDVKDTTINHYTATDEEGQFGFSKLSDAFYKMRITSVGYKPYLQYVRANGQNIDLGTLSIEQDTKILSEVEIKGEIVPIEQKGDTTQMNALAYKVNPDANAEDLIAKMPGIIVSNDKIQAQGEDVKKVLVDGKEFFSDDPKLALKSIPAEIIDKIEVFNQLSEQSQFSGYDDGNTTKTINIVTKPEMRNGQFGRIYGGYGTDDRYSVGGNINFFDDDRRFTILELSNNINQQNFSNEDLLGVASGGNRRRGRGGRGMRGQSFGRGGGNDFFTNQQGGISKTQSAGINYNDQLTDKLSLNGSYFFNRTDNQNNQFVNRETFLTGDSSQFYRENSFSSSVNNNHRLTMRLEYNLDEFNSIMFRPNLSIQQNKTSSSTTGQTTAGGELINSSASDYFNDRTGYNFSGNLLFRHRFEKRGRTFSMNVRSQINRDDGGSRQSSLSNYYLNDRQDSLNLFTDNYGNGNTLSANIAYTEPVGEKSQLQFNYEVSKTKNLSEKETYDYNTSEETLLDLDTALSNNFESNYVTHSPSLGFMYRSEKFMFRGGLSYQHSTLTSDQEFPVETTVGHSFDNILPGIMLRYRISTTSNLSMFLRSNTDAPSIRQLQNVIDNTDPLFFTAGNPSLDQSRSNMIVARYSNTNTDKLTNFFVFATARNIIDYVTNATFIAARDSVLADGILLNRGSQLSVPVNLDGYWNLRTFSTYGFPVKFLKSNLNANVGISCSKTPGITNGKENISKSYNVNAGLMLGSNISENVDFTISYTTDYTSVENTLQSNMTDDYVSQTVGSKFNLIFGKGFVFRNDLSYIKYSGYTDDSLNDSYALWNASLGKKFWKDNRGELTLTVFDLLGQNTSIARTNTESYFEETRTDVLQRYFMATFTYTIRNFREGS